MIESEMLAAAEGLEFERAAQLRDRLLQLKDRIGQDLASIDREAESGKGSVVDGVKGKENETARADRTSTEEYHEERLLPFFVTKDSPPMRSFLEPVLGRLPWIDAVVIVFGIGMFAPPILASRTENHRSPIHWQVLRLLPPSRLGGD